MNSRREFLKGTAWMGAAAIAAGCTCDRFGFGAGGTMQGFALKPMRRIRVGFVGIGMLDDGRGAMAIDRISRLPGLEIAAICDKNEERLRAMEKWLVDHKYPRPKTFGGEEGWKALCDLDDLDVVYNATPWHLHVPVGLRALRNGKVALIEVPSALTVDDCWELVETSEKMRIPCMQLENCCYGEIEMLEFHLAKLGLLGELVHGEGAYIHDLRDMTDARLPGEAEWRYAENLPHKGNRYPTHGLVPLCLAFDVNRGDRLDYLVSLESNQANVAWYMRNRLPADAVRLRDPKPEMGDMNTTLIKTALGRSLMIQHDVSSPRPYTRLNFISGTKGAIGDYPYRVVLEEKPGSGAHEWFDEKRAAEIREKYRHPMWRKVGELAKKVGGHGGMDFIMDLRWTYCLQNGLPLDMDVYDLATTCCLCELTEKSVRNRSRTYDIPDFTRGGWRTAKPMGVIDVDLGRFGEVENRKGQRQAGV